MSAVRPLSYDPMVGRTCPRCATFKTVSEFYAGRKPNTLRGWCKQCHSVSCAARAHTPDGRKAACARARKHIERMKKAGSWPERAVRYRSSASIRLEADPRIAILYSIKSGAKKRGIEFRITIDDIVIPDRCPVLGIPLIPYRRGKRADNTASLDRIDSSKGYIPGNVAVISVRANRGKNNLTAAEHLKIAEWMLLHEKTTS
jgi:hypothetical protein